MKYSVVPGRELTPELVDRWRDIQQAESALASPYFHPSFTRLVAAVRDDVFVGILENDNVVQGFFPFQRHRGGVARPVGLGLSDYHGVIAAPNAQWTAGELMRGCGLIRWEFDHLPVGQHQFTACHATVADSPIIEVAHGMEVFETSRDKSGRKQLREARRKKEKLAEQVGPLTFTLHTPDQRLLRQLIVWKSEQCRRTGTVDFFALDWCVRLIERIHAAREEDFGGLLACLHAGDTLVAIHFAMYSRQVWHSWFPAYNHELEEYSPGFILLLEMIQAASEQGNKHIDLGKGLSLYKKRVMTGAIQVAEGSLVIPSFRNRLWALRQSMEAWGGQFRLKPLLRIPGRLIKHMDRGTLKALARAIDAKSKWTAGHSERVTELSLAMGRFLGLNQEELDNIHRAALLHDVGKIGMPPEFLDKPSGLSDEEYSFIREHPKVGERILEPIEAYGEIIPMVKQHHEWFNGKGYPDGLSGEAITLGARILAVADVYDALSSQRPYRKKMSPKQVLQVIREGSGSHFDPRVVEALMGVLDKEQK